MNKQTAQIIAEPGVFGGRPYIEGHRITVQHVALHYEHFDWSVEQIADAFRLTPAQIHAALAYYYDHKGEIDQAIREDEEHLSRLPSLQDVLDGKLKLIVTPQEIADEFPISVNAVYQAIRRGRLRARKSGATWLILRRDAEELWGEKKG